jgi:hypothetical protein
MFVILSMFLDGRVCPCQPTAACWTTDIFRKNFGQCISEFSIKVPKCLCWCS